MATITRIAGWLGLGLCAATTFGCTGRSATSQSTQHLEPGCEQRSTAGTPVAARAPAPSDPLCQAFSPKKMQRLRWPAAGEKF